MPAPIVISVKTEFGKLAAELTHLEKTQLPFVKSQAANRLAKQAVVDLVAEMGKVFDRPTRWVLRGIYARTGTKKDPHGEVMIKEGGRKQISESPVADVLSAEILGGTRKLKRFERALGHRIGDATFIVPGKGAKLDAFGNLPNGQIQKVLSALGSAEHYAGYSANRTKRSEKRQKKRMEVYFVATSHRDGRPLAVYKVIGKGKVEPIFFFPRAKPRYHERLAFYAVVQRTVEKNSIPIFKEEMVKAMASKK